MIIEWISKNKICLNVDIHRKMSISTIDGHNELDYKDTAHHDDVNLVTLIQGPMSAEERIVIVSREESEPYIVIGGSEDSLFIEENNEKENSVIIRVNSTSDEKEYSKNDVKNTLSDAWAVTKFIYKKTSKPKEKTFREFVIYTKDFFQSVNSNDVLAYKDISFNLYDLTIYVSEIFGTGEYKDDGFHYQLALTIIALLKAEEFRNKAGLSTNYIYTIMADSAWIGSKFDT